MSKERLEEVDSWLLSMKETLFQAVKEGEKEEEIEEVQHLIDVYEWLREQAFAVHGGELFVGYKEQMNRYREALIKIKLGSESDVIHYSTRLKSINKIAVEALEGEE